MTQETPLSSESLLSLGGICCLQVSLVECATWVSLHMAQIPVHFYCSMNEKHCDNFHGNASQSYLFCYSYHLESAPSGLQVMVCLSRVGHLCVWHPSFFCLFLVLHPCVYLPFWPYTPWTSDSTSHVETDSLLSDPQLHLSAPAGTTISSCTGILVQHSGSCPHWSRHQG